MRPLFTAITLSTALAACAPAPVTKEETAGLDYGPSRRAGRRKSAAT